MAERGLGGQGSDQVTEGKPAVELAKAAPPSAQPPAAAALGKAQPGANAKAGVHGPGALSPDASRCWERRQATPTAQRPTAQVRGRLTG